MCSNCSGDDPEPESFALFDVSSPERNEHFAAAARNKRKRYGTGRFFAELVETALTLTIQKLRRSKRRPRIIGSVDRGSFVNLNLGNSSGEYLANSRNAQDTETLIEVRVSGDAIIEVIGNSDSDENTRNACGLLAREYLSTWEESRAGRNGAQRSLSGFRRTRRLKYVMAYGVFAAVAALAVWCAIR